MSPSLLDPIIRVVIKDLVWINGDLAYDSTIYYCFMLCYGVSWSVVVMVVVTSPAVLFHD